MQWDIGQKKIAPKQEWIPILQPNKKCWDTLQNDLFNTLTRQYQIRSCKRPSPIRYRLQKFSPVSWMTDGNTDEIKPKMENTGSIKTKQELDLFTEKLNFICKKISTTIELNNFSLVCKDSIIGLKSWILCLTV